VNSAFFGTARSLRTSHEAVGRLGLNTVRTLVVGLRVFDQFKEPSASGFTLTGLWQRGLAASKQCRVIANDRGANPVQCESAALAGLLHEVGRLALASGAGEKLGEAINVARARGMSLALAENNVIGVAQGAVGSYLLGLWGFADDVVEAVGLFEQMHDVVEDASPLSVLRAATSLPEIETLWRVPSEWSSDCVAAMRSAA
jgi:HD-like signal output (HDOD) protein